VKKEHKRYILENAASRSVEDIARELNLKTKKVRKFLESETEKRRTSTPVSAEHMVRQRKTAMIAVAIIMLAGLLVYANALGGKFIWDDHYLVENNVFIQNWSYLPYLFTQNIGAGARGIYYFYRPLQMLTYMTDRSLWGLNPFGYHLTSVLLHISVALCIYWLITILFGDRLLSIFTGLLFIVHPIHIEAVTYISGRADTLVGLLLLLTFILYIKSLRVQHLLLYAGIMVTYTLALFSRENALFLPILLLLYHYAFKEKIKIVPFAFVAGAAVLYIVLRVGVFRFLLPHAVCPTTFFQRLPGFFVAVTNYVRLLFLPFGLHMEYGDKLFSWGSYKALLGLAIFAFAVFYAYRNRNRNRLVFFSVMWFIVALLPSSNLYPLNAYMAEHWLYLPSIGFFLLMAHVFCYLYRQRRFHISAMAVFSVWLLFYSALTIRQNAYWRDPLTFYERALQYSPESPVLYNNLGILYGDMNRLDDAIHMFEKAIEVEPKYIYAYHNLGKAYHLTGEDKKAVALYEQLLEVFPDLPDAHYNLGNIYNESGRTQEAIAAYKEALRLSPHFAKAHYNLGNIYRDLGRYRDAVESYRQAVKFKPDFAYAHFNLALCYFKLREYEVAIKHFDIAKDLGYTDATLGEYLRPHRQQQR